MHSHRKSCDYDAPGYKNDVRNGLAFYVRVSDAGVPAKEAPHVWFHRFELTGEERNGGCQKRETEGLIFCQNYLEECSSLHVSVSLAPQDQTQIHL